MLRSMTAYGQATLAKEWGQLVVQIHSVNRRFREINVLVPKEFVRFDPDVKKWVSESVCRGQINVRIIAQFSTTSPIVVRPNLALARQLKQSAKTLTEELGIADLTEQFIAQNSDVIEVSESLENVDIWRVDLNEAIHLALVPFLEMKQQEGAALQKDIASRLSKCIPLIDEIEVIAPSAASRHREKLDKTLIELGLTNPDNEEKVIREIAIYADKIDITEELVRFRSHLIQFGRLLEEEEKSVGKTLEFLLQELVREVNTMSSKSADADVTRLVVEIKSELERIREQVQNVE